MPTRIAPASEIGFERDAKLVLLVFVQMLADSKPFDIGDAVTDLLRLTDETGEWSLVE